jgi:uncharacterized protein (DUF736 family)
MKNGPQYDYENQIEVVLFPNENKQNENQPDYTGTAVRIADKEAHGGKSQDVPEANKLWASAYKNTAQGTGKPYLRCTLSTRKEKEDSIFTGNSGNQPASGGW